MAWSPNPLTNIATLAATATSSTTASLAYSVANLSSGTTLIAVISGAAASGTQAAPNTVAVGGTNMIQLGTENSGGGAGSNTELVVYALNTPAGLVGTKPTVTVTWATAAFTSMVIAEVAGIVTGSTVAALVDGTPAGKQFTSGGTTATTAAYSTTAANELLIAAYADDGGPATQGTPTGSTTYVVGPRVSANSHSGVGLYYGNSTNGAETFSLPLTGTTTASEATLILALKLTASPPTVTTSSLPNATTGVAYSTTLAATGGTPPYTWSINTGSLPAWASLNGSTGAITGTSPTAGTSAAFTVKVTDSNSLTGTSGSLTITTVSNLHISTTSLPSGAVSLPYSQTLVATGGFGAYTWSLSSGSLPGGLSLSSGGVISGTPTTLGSSTFTVQVTDAGTNTTTQSLTIIIGTVGIVSQYPITDTLGYAPAPITVANTEGNSLVAIIAVGSDNVSGMCPRVSISDNAHNWWTLAGSQTVNTAGVARRLDVWVCENARAATTISVTTSQIYAGLSGLIAEVEGAPSFVSVDFVQHDTTVTGTSTTLSGTAAQTDFAMSAVALFGSNGPQTVTFPAAMTTNFPVVSTPAAATDMSDVQLYAAFAPNPVAAGAISAAWSWGNSAQILGLLLCFNATPPPPVQPNPQYPGIITEAAFGFSPGNQTGANPTWTNISSRAIDDSGHTTLTAQRGRDYELTEPEAGELDVLLNNQDGALNPSNSSSPFYPNVLPEAQLRSSMYWNGRRYGIGFSYATKWPQAFPYPQWGFVPYTGKDAISIISQGAMPSAYGGEVLGDFASTYYILGEFYDGAHGSQFGNSSRTNQTPMLGWSPVSLPPPATGTVSDYALQTGGTLGLLGDPNSGIGISGIQNTDTALGVGGGAFVRDNSLPQFWQTTNGVAYEFWTTGASTTGNASPVNVFSGFGPAWNFVSGTDISSGQIIQIAASPPSGNQASWTLTISTRAETGAGPGSPQTVTLTSSSGNWNVPTGVTTLTSVECYGPGTGGGGGSPNTAGVGANGGSGGAYAKATGLAVTPGTNIPYTVGRGSSGSSPTTFPHSASGPTTWNTNQVSADFSTIAIVSGEAVSTPGQAANCIGSVAFSGGQGGTGAQVNTGAGGGGGGSSASNAAAGNFGGSVFGSSGGFGGTLTGAGSGGTGGNYNGGDGTNGGFGAGGGGGASGGGDGGNGGNGKIVLTFTPTVANAGNEIALVTGTSTQAPVYHVVLTAQHVGSNYVFQLYVNGIQVLSATPAVPTTDLLVTALAVGPVPLNGGALLANNYTVGQLAAYPAVLPSQRILSHYNTGIYARQNKNGDTTSQRVSALMQWSGLGVPYGVALLDSMVPSAIGNADQIAGSALANALYSLTLDEGGMFYAPATALGEIWYAPRQTFYNQAPVAVLGDNPVDISNTNPNFVGRTGWTLTSMTGTDAADSTVPGGHSATFTVGSGLPTSANALYRSPVTGSQKYMLNGYINPITVSGSNLYSAQISWFQANGTHISDSISTGVNLPAGAWTFLHEGTWAVPVTAPPNAAFCTFGPAISNAGGIANGTQFKAGQFWLTCVSSEIPFDAGSGFDYSDTFVYNIVSSQRTISVSESYFINSQGQAEQQQFSTTGVNAVVADLASEAEFFPRGPLQLPIETTSDLDAYDRANWSLAKYRQPQLRANQVSVDLASNPGAIDAIMRLEQGSIVTVNRRPLGAPVISLNCMIQKIEVQAGPDLLRVLFDLSPYFPDNAVLRLDGSANSFLGSTTLPW